MDVAALLERNARIREDGLFSRLKRPTTGGCGSGWEGPGPGSCVRAKSAETTAKPPVQAQAEPVNPLPKTPRVPGKSIDKTTVLSGKSSPDAVAGAASDLASKARAFVKKDSGLRDNADVLRDIADAAEDEPETIRAVRDSKGVIQAVASVRTKGDSIYIEQLATAPWNAAREGSENKTKGSGTRMMADIIRESVKSGFGGKVTLESLPGAVGFYEKAGFQKTDPKAWTYKDMPGMELSPEAARAFMDRLGERLDSVGLTFADEMDVLETKARGAFCGKRRSRVDSLLERNASMRNDIAARCGRGWEGTQGSCTRSKTKTATPQQKPRTQLKSTAQKVGKEAKHQGIHLAENVAAWKIGKVVGGAIAGVATAHGANPEVSRLMGETAIQALAATALSLHNPAKRKPKDIAAKFVAEAGAAFVGKAAHGGMESAGAALGMSQKTEAISALLAGKVGGIGTNVGLNRSGFAGSSGAWLAERGAKLKRFYSKARSRSDSFNLEDVSAGMSGELSEALLDLSIYGYLKAARDGELKGERSDAASNQKCGRGWEGVKGSCRRSSRKGPKGSTAPQAARVKPTRETPTSKATPRQPAPVQQRRSVTRNNQPSRSLVGKLGFAAQRAAVSLGVNPVLAKTVGEISGVALRNAASVWKQSPRPSATKVGLSFVGAAMKESARLGFAEAGLRYNPTPAERRYIKSRGQKIRGFYAKAEKSRQDDDGSELMTAVAELSLFAHRKAMGEAALPEERGDSAQKCGKGWKGIKGECERARAAVKAALKKDVVNTSTWAFGKTAGAFLAGAAQAHGVSNPPALLLAESATQALLTVGIEAKKQGLGAGQVAKRYMSEVAALMATKYEPAWDDGIRGGSEEVLMMIDRATSKDAPVQAKALFKQSSERVAALIRGPKLRFDGAEFDKEDAEALLFLAVAALGEVKARRDDGFNEDYGVACGGGWITHTKRCSPDKRKSTPPKARSQSIAIQEAARRLNKRRKAKGKRPVNWSKSQIKDELQAMRGQRSSGRDRSGKLQRNEEGKAMGSNFRDQAAAKNAPRGKGVLPRQPRQLPRELDHSTRKQGEVLRKVEGRKGASGLKKADEALRARVLDELGFNDAYRKSTAPRIDLKVAKQWEQAVKDERSAMVPYRAAVKELRPVRERLNEIRRAAQENGTDWKSDKEYKELDAKYDSLAKQRDEAWSKSSKATDEVFRLSKSLIKPEKKARKPQKTKAQKEAEQSAKVERIKGRLKSAENTESSAQAAFERSKKAFEKAAGSHDKVSEHFPLGMVGGSGKNARKLDKRRATDTARTQSAYRSMTEAEQKLKRAKANTARVSAQLKRNEKQVQPPKDSAQLIAEAKASRGKFTPKPKPASTSGPDSTVTATSLRKGKKAAKEKRGTTPPKSPYLMTGQQLENELRDRGQTPFINGKRGTNRQLAQKLESVRGAKSKDAKDLIKRAEQLVGEGVRSEAEARKILARAKKPKKRKRPRNVSIDAADKAYYFRSKSTGKVRNTAVFAPDLKTAKKHLRRPAPADAEVASVRKPLPGEIKRGVWSRRRPDGKTPAQSKYGKGRGFGPPRSKQSA